MTCSRNATMLPGQSKVDMVEEAFHAGDPSVSSESSSGVITLKKSTHIHKFVKMKL